jgi:shikimate dehydrogenase
MTIANRTLARAQTLAEELGPEGAKAVSLSELSSALKTATCVVNTSSLGMSGKENAGQDGLPFSLADLPPEAFVTDIVYTPLQTPLLEVAQKRGCRTADGLGMLLHQAVPGFEKWFGVLPQVTPSLRSMILKDMGLAE